MQVRIGVTLRCSASEGTRGQMKSDTRRQAEPAVPDGETLFGSLLAQTAVGIAVISPEGSFLRANDALCRMLGYGEQELLQKTVRDITHVDDLESTQEIQLELLAGPGSRVHERRYLRKDGSALWVQIAGTSVRERSGQPQCFVAVVHDITALKLAQDALRASESRFRRMVELSSDWYWVQDENFRFVELSGVEKRGIDPEPFIGKARWELQNPGSLPEKAWRQHREMLERHEPFSDFVYMTPDNAGELRYRMLFDIHPRPMWVVENKTLRFLAVNQGAVDHYGYSREEFLSMTAEQLRPREQINVEIVSFNLTFDGRPARLGVINDVTERLKAEQQARELEQRYRALLESRKASGSREGP